MSLLRVVWRKSVNCAQKPLFEGAGKIPNSSFYEFMYLGSLVLWLLRADKQSSHAAAPTSS
jgi:hypothetical protein